MTPATLPVIIQGGMGVGVSSWRLARSVSRAGQLGVVSGTALDLVLARRLQDGDPEGDVRRAMADFPDQAMAQRVLEEYFRPDGRAPGTAYRRVPKPTLRPKAATQELTVLGNFVEVWLAKEGHAGEIGINYLEKIQMATPAAALGALLAGVDYVLMGAGVPREIPRLLDDLTAGRPGSVEVVVQGADAPRRVEVDPRALLAVPPPAMRRPRFLAIVSATVLAAYLARDDATRPDGFVIEGHVAGGHNAPPRGTLVLDDAGAPVYGPRDEVDLAKVAALGLPFWLAGGVASPEQVREAQARGATGVQVGTLFALAAESGLTPALRGMLLAETAAGGPQVRTDPSASPTGFPFKVAELPGTLADPEVYAQRTRICDLGYLRAPYQTPAGTIDYRCPSEPVKAYVRKGGREEDTQGRACLCNALSANVGIGQPRRGYVEPALVTLGEDLSGARALAARHHDGWGAADVVSWLTGAVS